MSRTILSLRIEGILLAASLKLKFTLASMRSIR